MEKENQVFFAILEKSVKDKMNEHNTDQSGIAEMCGVHPSKITNLLDGKQLHRDNLMKILVGLDALKIGDDHPDDNVDKFISILAIRNKYPFVKKLRQALTEAFQKHLSVATTIDLLIKLLEVEKIIGAPQHKTCKKKAHKHPHAIK